MAGQVDWKDEVLLLKDVGLPGPSHQSGSIVSNMNYKLFGYSFFDAVEFLLISDVLSKKSSHEVGVVKEHIVSHIGWENVFHEHLQVKVNALPVEILLRLYIF